MTDTSANPTSPPLPRRLLDDGWWLVPPALAEPARVIPFPRPAPAPPRAPVPIAGQRP